MVYRSCTCTSFYDAKAENKHLIYMYMCMYMYAVCNHINLSGIHNNDYVFRIYAYNCRALLVVK